MAVKLQEFVLNTVKYFKGYNINCGEERNNMSKKYVVIACNDLTDMEEKLNESAELKYRFLSMTPVYSPVLFGQKLHGYVVIVKAD